MDKTGITMESMKFWAADEEGAEIKCIKFIINNVYKIRFQHVPRSCGGEMESIGIINIHYSSQKS